MESRKRPLTEADDSVANKKRILTGVNGGPHVNGSDEDEGFREKLETYRKEAIYRRMMHYSREHQRSIARIQELERRKITCEASLAAISACWTQLVETIKMFVKTDELSEASTRAKELFDLSTRIEQDSQPELRAALGETVNTTQALITKFVQLAEDKKSSILKSEAFSECQNAQNESFLLRSELNILRVKLQDSEVQRERYHSALVAAENRFERSQSAIVHEVEDRSTSRDPDDGAEEKEDVPRKPSSPAQSSTSATPIIPHDSFHDASSEIQILVEQLKTRDTKILELEREAVLLRDEKTALQLELKVPSYEQSLSNPFFRALLDQISCQEATLSEKMEENRRLTEDVQQLHSQLTARTDLHVSVKADFEQTINDLSYKLEEKNEENVRLRMQRNQFQAEVNERKAKDSIKFASLQEYKSSLESNSERLIVMQSELRRCKARLAANAGAEDLLTFFLAGNCDESKFCEALKEEKFQLESRVAVLEKTLAGYEYEHPDIVKHMRAQADAMEQLSKATVELQNYRQVFGESCNLSPDVTQLAEQLRAKETELEKFRLIARELESNQSSLYSELDQLAVQWESLDKQVKSKIFNLHSLEERLLRCTTEKAKAETKYFEAVKVHQAAEAERKALQRTLEMQEKVLQSMQSLTPKLQHQVTNLEKECVALKKGNAHLQDRNRELEKENPELKANLDVERKRTLELTNLFNERENILQTKRKELRAKEDEFVRITKDMEKQITQARREVELHKSNSRSNIADSELDNLRSLLICSTCRGPARSTIITKCMHTFCKGCVDSRLSTRQRKCPACNLPFGASDVHTFFFQ